MLDAAMPCTEAPALHVLQLGMEWFTAASAGGVSRYYTDLFRSLSQSGVAPTGLVSGPPDVASMTGGRVHCFARGASLPARLLGARRAVDRVLRQDRFDVVASHFALYAAPVLDKLRGTPLVCHFHGPWAAESAREGEAAVVVALKGGVERLVYRRAERVVVLSHAFATLAARDYGIPRDRLRVVPGSVDLDRFDIAETREQAREQLGWPLDRPILLTVRRLAGRMGIDRLLTAMVQVARARPEVLLIVGGKGPLAQALRRQSAALGLDAHVRFVGFLPDSELPLAYRAADINVIPSESLEGFGLAAAEALAAGTPTMVTPVGGLPELVAGLTPDLVFGSGGADAMAEGLSAALGGHIRLPDAATCTAHARSRFDPALCGERTAAIYREVA